MPVDNPEVALLMQEYQVIKVLGFEALNQPWEKVDLWMMAAEASERAREWQTKK